MPDFISRFVTENPMAAYWLKACLWVIGLFALYIPVLLGGIYLYAHVVKKGSEVSQGAATLLAMAGGPIVIGIVTFVASANLLWRKFLQNDPSVSRWAWIMAMILLVSAVQGGMQGFTFLKQAFFPVPQDQQQDNG